MFVGCFEVMESLLHSNSTLGSGYIQPPRTSLPATRWWLDGLLRHCRTGGRLRLGEDSLSKETNSEVSCQGVTKYIAVHGGTGTCVLDPALHVTQIGLDSERTKNQLQINRGVELVKLKLEIEHDGRQVAPRTVYGRVEAGVVVLTLTDDGRVGIHGLQISLLLLCPQQVT